MTLQDEATAMGDMTTRHDFLPLFPSASYGHGVDNEGDGATDDDGDNGDGATDDDVDEDGDATVRQTTTATAMAMGRLTTMTTMTTMATTATAWRRTTTTSTTTTKTYDVNVDNLPPRVGKRNDGCDEMKTEEEETVADSVVIHTTIKQITGRGGW
jgi:hypothetical protein